MRSDEEITKPEVEFFRTSRFLQIMWWCLWLSSIFLLTFQYKYIDGTRTSFLYGQYIFFIFTFFASIFIILNFRTYFLTREVRNFILFILFFSCVLGLSALLGLSPFAGSRLLVIILVTSTPFVLLGLLGEFMPYKRIMEPVVGMIIFCIFATWLLIVSGPVTFINMVFDNHLFGHTWRWAFLFNEANDYGWMLAAGFTATLYQLSVSQSVKYKIVICTVLMPFLLVTFWKTNSRGSSIWFFLSCVMYFTLYLRTSFWGKNKAKYFILGLLLAILIVIFLVLFNWETVFGFFRLDKIKVDDFTTGRMQVWLVIFEEIKQHPLLGYGFAATPLITEGLPQESMIRPPLTGPLNTFVGISGEAGLLGLGSLLILWGGAIYKAWNVFKEGWNNKNDTFYFAFFLMVMLLGMAIQQNGEWLVLRVTSFNFLFFFLVSSAWALKRSSPNKIENKNNSQ
jgi:O-antigen ligase